MATRVGRLKLKIHQVRHLSFYPKSLERGCRSEKALKLAIAEMYVKGVSTRKVSQITEQLCGTEISASRVSRIAQLLDGELEQFRERELGAYRVVYLDAHYEKVRANSMVRDLAILKAIGVNGWGKREVPATWGVWPLVPAAGLQSRRDAPPINIAHRYRQINRCLFHSLAGDVRQLPRCWPFIFPQGTRGLE